MLKGHCFYSRMAEEVPIIRDNVSNFIDKDEDNEVRNSGEPSNQTQFITSPYFETIHSQLQQIYNFQILIKVGVTIWMLEPNFTRAWHSN